MTNDNFFIASKLLYYLILPETFLAFTVIAGFLCQLFERKRLALQLSVISSLIIIILGFVPICMPALQWLETRYPANPEILQLDGIIVLGGAEDPKGMIKWNQVQLNGAAERLTEAVLLAKKFPNTKIIFTGGSNLLSNMGANISPAIAAERFFVEHGISSERLILETKSRNTSENATLTYNLIPHKNNQKWLLITSSYHMLRAMHSFKAAGWDNIIAYPVDFNSTDNYYEATYWNLSGNLQGINLLIKEYVGLAAYRLFDK